MATPIKARKKPKNQPVTFSETLAPTPVYAPVADVSFRLSERQQRIGLATMWASAMVLIGVAAGWRIVAVVRSAATAPGRPQATNPVAVVPLSFNPNVARPQPAAQPNLKVATADAVTQAGVGSPFTTLSAGTFQPADAPDALQPGFQTEVTPQGTVGTDPAN